VRALCAVVVALALTAAFLFTGGTSRAGVAASGPAASDLAEKPQRVALTRAAHERRVVRQHRRAVRRLRRELRRQFEVAVWTAAATPRFRCPVDGSRSFTNDWGDPRSGGRRHRGTDIMAAYGAPVVAPVGGTVEGTSSGSGGTTFELTGDDGVTYFGMHLSRLGATDRVASGAVIGYVGTSGNARGGSAHLHFEIHPGGGGAVNPYPTVASYC